MVLSEGKKEQEEAMDKLKEERLQSDLNKLKKSIKKRKLSTRRYIKPWG